MLENTSPELASSPDPLSIVRRTFVGALVGTVGLVALYLLTRRLGGALVAPLDFVPALAIGLLVAVGTWSLRRLALAVVPEPSRLVLGITAFTWLVVVCLTLSETSPLAVLALWLPVIATEALWRVTDHAAASPVDLTHSLPRPSSPSSPSSAESLVQQLTRTRENGQERVSGKARIEFAAGEQTTALHVVFCPPLDHDPEVDVEAIDAEEVSVRATECRSYGLRFEVRRGRDAAGPLRVLVQFEASSATG